MFKYDFESASPMLITLKKSFDIFLKDNVAFNSFEKIGAQTELGQEVARIKNEYGDNLNVQNLDFQYKKLIQIASDIHHLKLIHDDTLPEWLEVELDSVFQKIKNILMTLERELN